MAVTPTGAIMAAIEAWEFFVSIADLRDENLVHFYESIRKEVDADRGSKHQFMAAPSVREYAESLRGEITRRRLECAPIIWPSDQNE